MSGVKPCCWVEAKVAAAWEPGFSSDIHAGARQIAGPTEVGPTMSRCTQNGRLLTKPPVSASYSGLRRLRGLLELIDQRLQHLRVLLVSGLECLGVFVA